MITKSRSIVNGVVSIVGKGYVFNDRLVDGRRSIKVWGWENSEYQFCKELLEKAGCTVKMVNVRINGTYNPRVYLRMHVTE